MKQIDLTKQAPRSPAERLGGYVILARAIDKCRAELSDALGEYHFGCALDAKFFDFKDVKIKDFKGIVEGTETDEEILEWLSKEGEAKSVEEIEKWSDEVLESSPYHSDMKKEWFAEQCALYGLDPENTTLFELLEADDKAGFSGN